MHETPEFLDVRGKLLHFPSLSIPLRVLAGLGISQVVVAVFMLLFRDVPFPTVLASEFQDKPVVIPIPFLLIGTSLIVVGWTYMLAGVIRTRWWVSFLVLVFITVGLAPGYTSGGGFPLGPIAMLLVWLYFLARHVALRRVWELVDVVVLGLLVASVILCVPIMALARGSADGLIEYPISISSQSLFLLVLLIPMLVVAGVDLAEISADASAWAVDHLLDLVPIRVGAAAVALMAAVKIVLDLGEPIRNLGLLFMLPGMAAAIVLVAVTGWISYRLRAQTVDYDAYPPFWLLILLAVLLFAVQTVAFGATHVMSAESGTGVLVAVQNLGVLRTWSIAGLTAIAIGVLVLLRSRVRRRPVPPGGVFILAYGVWTLLTVGNPLRLVPGLTDVDTGVLVRLPQIDAAASICVLVLIAALARAGRLGRGTLGLSATALVALTMVGAIQNLYGQKMSATDLLMLGQVALFLVVPAVGLVGIIRNPRTGAYGRTFARLALSLVAVLALAVVGIMLAASLQIPIPALPPEAPSVVVLALVFLWDFLMSGERLTNQHGPSFPRSGRLLLYAGYVSLSAAALLWSKSLMPQAAADAAGGASAAADLGFFDENLIPPFGLLVLGVPVLLYHWAVVGRRRWSERAAERAAVRAEP